MSRSHLHEIESILDRWSGLRALVVGDLLLDEYRVGDVVRVSPEAPVPIVQVRSIRSELGGAANVARGVCALDAACELVGLVGADEEGETLVGLVTELGIDATGILGEPARPTSHKLRIVGRGQQMLRVDREECRPIGPEAADRLRAVVAERLDRSDVVILEDYDKGLFGDGLGRWIIELARSRGIPVVADPKADLARFRGASLIKPNRDEALALVGGRVESFVDRQALLEKIQRAMGGGQVVLTRGREGVSGLDTDGSAFDIATRPLEVFDVQGAGDTSVAALALCRAAGASLVDACIVANAAAAVVVEKVGTAAVTRTELRDRLPEILAVQRELGSAAKVRESSQATEGGEGSK